MDETATARRRKWLLYRRLLTEANTRVLSSRMQLVPTLFCAVVGANCLAMSWMNFFESPARYVAIIYISFMFATATLILSSGITFPKLTRGEHAFCVTLGLIIFLPRAPYLLEGVLGYSTNNVGDDWCHIQEMSSIVHTAKFPPRSVFDSQMYLSYYYAPFMLGAALYWTGLLSTVKQALGLTVMVYAIFSAYFAVYAAKYLFAEKRLQKVFMVTCVLYGGFDFVYWVSNLTLIPSHSEWWATEFGFRLQFSNFFTLSLWVQQHFISALAVLFGLFVVFNSKKISALVLAGVCFLSAFFSSVFAVIGAIPLLVYFFIKFRLLKTIPVIALAFGVFSLPLWWIFLGKSGEIGFQRFGALSDYWMEHKRASFLVFLLIISLELLPLIAGAFARASTRGLLWLFLGALSYLLSTFFVAFSGANNYAMRGAIIPIFTLVYLSVPALESWVRIRRQWWVRIGIATYLLGGVLEYASFSRNALLAVETSNTAVNIKALRFNEGSDGLTPEFFSQAEKTFDWYLLERSRPKKQHLLPDDREAMTSDNRYRLSASRLFGSRVSESGAP